MTSGGLRNIKPMSQKASDLPLITHVAVYFEGRIYSLPKPSRHGEVVRSIGGMYGPSVQGFLTSQGHFINRRQAMLLARRNGQLNRDMSENSYQGEDLYSEDLW